MSETALGAVRSWGPDQLEPPQEQPDGGAAAAGPRLRMASTEVATGEGAPPAALPLNFQPAEGLLSLQGSDGRPGSRTPGAADAERLRGLLSRERRERESELASLRLEIHAQSQAVDTRVKKVGEGLVAALVEQAREERETSLETLRGELDARLKQVEPDLETLRKEFDSRLKQAVEGATAAGLEGMVRERKEAQKQAWEGALQEHSDALASFRADMEARLAEVEDGRIAAVSERERNERDACFAVLQDELDARIEQAAKGMVANLLKAEAEASLEALRSETKQCVASLQSEVPSRGREPAAKEHIGALEPAVAALRGEFDARLQELSALVEQGTLEQKSSLNILRRELDTRLAGAGQGDVAALLRKESQDREASLAALRTEMDAQLARARGQQQDAALNALRQELRAQMEEVRSAVSSLRDRVADGTDSLKQLPLDPKGDDTDDAAGHGDQLSIRQANRLLIMQQAEAAQLQEQLDKFRQDISNTVQVLKLQVAQVEQVSSTLEMDVRMLKESSVPKAPSPLAESLRAALAAEPHWTKPPGSPELATSATQARLQQMLARTMPAVPTSRSLSSLPVSEDQERSEPRHASERRPLARWSASLPPSGPAVPPLPLATGSTAGSTFILRRQGSRRLVGKETGSTAGSTFILRRQGSRRLVGKEASSRTRVQSKESVGSASSLLGGALPLGRPSVLQSFGELPGDASLKALQSSVLAPPPPSVAPVNLNEYLLRDLAAENPLEHPVGFRAESDGDRTVLVHRGSGVKLWPVAQPLADASDADLLLYYYTDHSSFHAICETQEVFLSLLRQARRSDAPFGAGVYMTMHSPEHFGTKSAILTNLHSNSGDRATQLLDIEPHCGEADYCVPFLVRKCHVKDVTQEATKEMAFGAGFTVRGEYIHADRDIQVVCIDPVEVAVQQLEDSAPDARANAARYLRTLAARGDSRAVGGLLPRLAAEHDAGVRAAVAGALGEVARRGDAAASAGLRRCLGAAAGSSDTTPVREAAALALGKVVAKGDKLAVEALAWCLDTDPDRAVRASAAFVLGRMATADDVRAVEALTNRFEDADEDERVIAVAGQALKRLGMEVEVEDEGSDENSCVVS
uniref:Uncharacterized protein n=1 Tax=Alexandrium monilatum TaxID=311494 RepID=A0A7S4RD24_9DINO